MKLPNDLIIIIINYAMMPICNKLKCQKEQLYNLINYNDFKLEELTIQERKRIFKLYNKTYS